MNKVVDLIRRARNFLAIFIAIFTLGYFVFLDDFLEYCPLPLYLNFVHTYRIGLAICMFILLLVLFTTKFPRFFRFVAFMIVFLPFCLFSILAIETPEQVLDSVVLAGNRYYFTVVDEGFKPFLIYSVYKCDSEGYKCIKRFSDTSGTGIEDENLIVDEKGNEIYAFRRGSVIYADGAQSHEILKSEQFDNNIYYVGVYPPYGHSKDGYTYVLFKCDLSFMRCQQLPFHYTDTGGSFRFIFDSNSKEIKVYQVTYDTDDVLIYSLASEAKCYVEGCDIPAK